MTYTLSEDIDSRRTVTGDNPSTELEYTFRGTADDHVAKDVLESCLPKFRDGLARQSIDLQAKWVDETVNDGIWDVTVRYGLKPPAESDEWTFSFDTTGGSQNITQSLATVGKYVASGTAPDFKGAIGVTRDSVEGVDIVVPVFNFTLRRRIPRAQWIASYIGSLFQLTGKVNSTGFWIQIEGERYQFNAGEVLFLGASGDDSTASEFVDVMYRFAASPNRENIEIGDITVTSKLGWEYLWVRYEDGVDQNMIVQRPVAAYVEQVYEYGDFSVIGMV